MHGLEVSSKPSGSLGIGVDRHPVWIEPRLVQDASANQHVFEATRRSQRRAPGVDFGQHDGLWWTQQKFQESLREQHGDNSETRTWFGNRL